MSQPILVQIVGAPIACKEGVKDSWRDISKWAADHLKMRFGEAVDVRYFDLFDADCPPMPAGAQLPLVLVNGEVTINGGKIDMPVIRRKVERVLEIQAV